MQYYKINGIGKCKIKQADFQILPTQVSIFSQESFCHKKLLKRGFQFDRDNLYFNNMEKTFFPTEIEARRELARLGLVSKNHYHPQLIQFYVLNDPR